MAAEREEIVVGEHLLTLQQAGEHLRDLAFQPGLRRPSCLAFTALRLRQGLAIQLAVGAQRQITHFHQRHRHHVRRQTVGQRRAQGFRIPVRARLHHQIAHQLARIAAGIHRRALQHQRVRHRLAHARQRQQGMVDFAQLDTLPADLQLIVAAAQIFHRAVRQPARHVAGAVHAPALAERIGDKAAGGQIRSAKVAVRQLHAGQIQIARHARRHRPQARVRMRSPVFHTGRPIGTLAPVTFASASP